MTNQEAKAKIQKLLALAKGNGAFVNESNVALEKAKLLADKYGITIRFQDWNLSCNTGSQSHSVNNKKKSNLTNKWAPEDFNSKVLDAIVKAFGYRAAINKNNKSVSFYNGKTQEEITQFENYYNMLHKTMRLCNRHYQTEYKKLDRSFSIIFNNVCLEIFVSSVIEADFNPYQHKGYDATMKPCITLGKQLRKELNLEF